MLVRERWNSGCSPTPTPTPHPHAVSPSPRALTQWNCGDSERADPARPSPAAGRRFLWPKEKNRFMLYLAHRRSWPAPHSGRTGQLLWEFLDGVQDQGQITPDAYGASDKMSPRPHLAPATRQALLLRGSGQSTLRGEPRPVSCCPAVLAPVTAALSQAGCPAVGSPLISGLGTLSGSTHRHMRVNLPQPLHPICPPGKRWSG